VKLKLPDVTLVCVETREHTLARMAVEDCMRSVEFGDVLILTDRPLEFSPLTFLGQPRFSAVPDWPEKIGWSRSWWFDVPPLLRTSHTLNIQWDSWIWDPIMWRNEFLQYDYIGAPWKHLPENGKRVGNGGFSLVSSRLKRFIYDRRDRFPCDSAVDDALLCIKYRPALEDAGFVWAPEHVAYDFSFEGCDGSQPTAHFGFHALFNFPHVLDKDRLFERMEVVLRSPNIMKPDSYMMRAFCEKNPAITQEIMSQAQGAN